MKIEARYLRLASLFWTIGRKQCQFLAKGGALQLQETGLVVQAYQRRLFMPILDIFFRSALSEWTTVTIPYSRIQSLRFADLLVARLVMTMLIWSPLFLMVLVATTAGPGPVNFPWYEMLLFSLLFSVLTLYFVFRVLVPRCYLLFWTADNVPTWLCFRIKGKQRRAEFVKRVHEYCGALAPISPTFQQFPVSLAGQQAPVALLFVTLGYLLWMGLVNPVLTGLLLSSGSIAWTAGTGLGTLFWMIHQLFEYVPLGMLIFLLWRSYSPVKWITLALLICRCFGAVTWPMFLAILPGDGRGIGPKFTLLDTGIGGLIGAAFFAALALVLWRTSPASSERGPWREEGESP